MTHPMAVNSSQWGRRPEAGPSNGTGAVVGAGEAVAGVGGGAGAAVALAAADETDGMCGSCDFTSYCYFTLALALFAVGTVITVFSLDDGATSALSTLGHMWLLGPIFISSGLMVAVKTVLYLRKKNLVTLIFRQRALFRELQGLQMQPDIVRNPSAVTLPPPYESAVGQTVEQDNVQFHGLHSTFGNCNVNLTAVDEVPPPSYEEAMLLVRHNMGQTFPLTEVQAAG